MSKSLYHLLISFKKRFHIRSAPRWQAVTGFVTSCYTLLDSRFVTDHACLRSTFTPSLCLRISVIWFVLSSSNITPSLMFGNALGGSGILQTLHWALCLDGSTLGGSGMRFNKYDTIHGKESDVGFQCLSKNKKKWGAKIKIKPEEVCGKTKENPVIIMDKWYRGYS